MSDTNDIHCVKCGMKKLRSFSEGKMITFCPKGCDWADKNTVEVIGSSSND